MKKILLQRYAIFWSRSKYKPLFFPVLLRQARHFRTKKHQGIKICPFFSQEEGIFVRKSRAFSFTSFHLFVFLSYASSCRRSDDSRLSAPRALSVARMRTRATTEMAKVGDTQHTCC